MTLETEEGAAVKCIFDGEVTSVFDIEGESNILIRHGKYFTTYGHLASVTVTKGQKLKAGQVIGKAGTNSDGNGEVEVPATARSKEPGSCVVDQKKVR